ncbi:MAG: phosphodiester glycosidase family protein [Candidatus Peribacteria bacterium]|nr:phosphodiester glycosidase family protein [Candidatus Peribacteria bacterium]
MNGAFFCPKDYTQCNGQTFSYYERIFKGDGASYSMFWPDTSVRGIFGFLRDGTPLLVQNKISTHDVGLMSNINAERINELYFGISNFPVLLIEGEDVTAGAREYIDNKLTGKGNRNFICSTKDEKTIYMGVIGGSSVWDMAPYLKQHFDCYNALFLDAGASTAMVYDEKVLERSDRRLITDAFVVVDKEQYLTLGGILPQNVAPYIPKYQLTDVDKKFVSKLTTIIDLIYEQYDKATYKTKLISMFRKLINNGKLTDSQKAVYNQVLIYLFTIDKL